ncbi:MAG: NAD-dependent epimerase/dehydratase family protein [Acidobacteria bacterium]|nr:NAD-dependent epimerase/dehydratase family protein [Acidobacteriota bacterium]
MSAAPGPVLVTGAGGFAGGYLLELLAGAGDELVAWARSPVPRHAVALARWQQVDLLDRETVRRTIDTLRPSQVYHCAGSPHVAQSWQDTAGPLAANVLGTHHLLDALRRTGAGGRVLVTGSAAIYASSPVPIAEDHVVAPASPYALSKLAQEELSLRFLREEGLDVVVARPFNHTGPRQSAAFVAPSMARQVALIERGALEPVIKVGNLDAQRDISDVRDVVRAYAALMRAGCPGTSYNVASGVGRTMRSILDGLLMRARVPVQVATDPARLRPNDVPFLVGDPSRLGRTTGWKPAIPFDRTLDDLLEYWRAHA